MARNKKSARRGAKEKAPSARFDLDNPVLPKAIEEAALGSGGYPNDKKLKRGEFEDPL
jgi:hypothetical protein